MRIRQMRVESVILQAKNQQSTPNLKQSVVAPSLARNRAGTPFHQNAPIYMLARLWGTTFVASLTFRVSLVVFPRALSESRGETCNAKAVSLQRRHRLTSLRPFGPLALCAGITNRLPLWRGLRRACHEEV